MKRNSTILFLFISMYTFAQFPAPTNFTLQGKYIVIGDCDFCLSSNTFCGPASCSAFSWQAPTESTTAILDYYVIYGKDINNNITFTQTVSATSYWNQIAPVGSSFYVTAVYTNPNGESLPSNIVAGWAGIPIENKPVQSAKENIVHIYSNQTLKINSSEIVTKINLIDSNGRIVKSIQNPSETVNISELSKGFYIVEVYCENNDVMKQKIVK